MTKAILVVQTVSFLLMGVLLIRQGQWRLGVAQLLLAAVQAVVYSGEMAR